MILQAEVFKFSEKEPPEQFLWIWNGDEWREVRWNARRRIWQGSLGGVLGEEDKFVYWTLGLPSPEGGV
jgi:hypothetical protein